jgi:RecQ helicase-like protein
VETRFIGPKKDGTGGSRDIDPEESDIAEDVSEVSQDRHTRRQTDSEVRTQLPDVMYEFCNSDRCLRSIILSHYLEEFEEGHSSNDNPCCSNCQPDLGQLPYDLDAPKTERKHFLTGRSGQSERSLFLLRAPNYRAFRVLSRASEHRPRFITRYATS